MAHLHKGQWLLAPVKKPRDGDAIAPSKTTKNYGTFYLPQVCNYAAVLQYSGLCLDGMLRQRTTAAEIMEDKGTPRKGH